jgi:phosphoribosylamine--glycine ligase
MTRRVCVVGAGAREHALALALSRSAEVVVTPGNPGIEGPDISVTSDPPTDVAADLYIVGPEQPLVDGLADELRAQGRLVVGPGRDGALLEGSKAFMKEVLVAAGVPTARHGAFDDEREALAFLDSIDGTVVVKTDGLASGKGVLVTADHAAAAADVRAKLSGSLFGDAGRRVVIEEGLEGSECSLLVLVDGTSAVPMTPARDYKRLRDGDAGPNTGGMGAVSPASGFGDDLVDDVMERAVRPTLDELSRRGIDYRGVLYAGIMVTPEGPKILEYNVRLGDPEAEVVLPRLADDPFDLFESVAAGTLGGVPRFSTDAAVTVVLAAAGYPVAPASGARIRGLARNGQLEDRRDGVFVFHAGTRIREDHFVTSGGRVLAITALGPSVAAARARAYEAAATITFEGMQVRHDIAAEPEGSPA